MLDREGEEGGEVESRGEGGEEDGVLVRYGVVVVVRPKRQGGGGGGGGGGGLLGVGSGVGGKGGCDGGVVGAAAAAAPLEGEAAEGD